jgi:hypothetical protein
MIVYATKMIRTGEAIDKGLVRLRPFDGFDRLTAGKLRATA